MLRMAVCAKSSPNTAPPTVPKPDTAQLIANLLIRAPLRLSVRSTGPTLASQLQAVSALVSQGPMTRLVARLLGLRLLRVDGVVLVSPGRVREAPLPPPPGQPDAPSRRLDGERPGDRLALAERLIASTGSRLERANGISRR